MVFALAALGTAAADDFKGFYAGVNLGASYGSSDATTTTIFSPTGYFATTSPGAIGIAGAQSLKPTRLSGGFQAGYNHEAGSWLFGVEGNMGSMHLSDTAIKSGTYPCCAPTGFTVRQSINTDYLLTVGPRLGWVHGRFLLYGTGGLALTNPNYQSFFTDTFATARENGGVSDLKMGWFGGGGVEVKTSRHWSLKGEFLYADFGTMKATSNNLTAFSPPIAFPTNTFTHTATLKASTFRAGANFYF